MSSTYDIDHEAEASKVALLAIIARIQGEWDNPFLMQFGELSTNTTDDILRIVESAGVTPESVYGDETAEEYWARNQPVSAPKL